MLRYLMCAKPFGTNALLDLIRRKVSFHAGLLETPPRWHATMYLHVILLRLICVALISLDHKIDTLLLLI